MRRWEWAVAGSVMVVSLVVAVPWGIRNALLLVQRDGWLPLAQVFLVCVVFGAFIYRAMGSATRRR